MRPTFTIVPAYISKTLYLDADLPLFYPTFIVRSFRIKNYYYWNNPKQIDELRAFFNSTKETVGIGSHTDSPF